MIIMSILVDLNLALDAFSAMGPAMQPSINKPSRLQGLVSCFWCAWLLLGLALAGCSAVGPRDRLTLTSTQKLPHLSPAAGDEDNVSFVMPFSDWLQQFRAEAMGRGVREITLDAALAHVSPDERIVRLDQAQSSTKASKASYALYIRRHLTDAKKRQAVRAYALNRPQLEQASQSTGVPVSIILGIWGIESNFGTYTSPYPVMRSLVTLAYEGRRATLFREEALIALTLVDQGQIALADLHGSWAGAFGQPQFLPSSYMRHAVDADGDGKRDIWRSLPDVFASIGKYLVNAGWKPGTSWGLPVVAPPNFDASRFANAQEAKECKLARSKHSVPKPIKEWKALNFMPSTGYDWPADDAMATLLQPDGPGGASFLALENYQAILSYNCSNFYALSVVLLGDAAA